MSGPLQKSQHRETKRGRQEIIVFLALTFALSSIFYTKIIAGGGLGEVSSGVITGLMWCPGIAALITRLALTRDLRGLGWRPGKLRFLAAGYFTPLLYAALAYGLVWLLSGGSFFDRDIIAKIAAALSERKGWSFGSEAAVLAAYFLLIATRGVFFGCISALGEEIGWRGLLVPRLAETRSYTQTSWISGIIWAVWHWPLILLAGYQGSSPAFSLVTFTLMAVAASFILAWLRLRSGSVWTAMLLHASHNAFIQSFFDPLTRTDGVAKYLTGEFGIATLAAVGLFAWLYWRRRGELDHPDR